MRLLIFSGFCAVFSLWFISGCDSGENRNPAENRDLRLPDTVTFSEHIAPLIHQNCTPCHRPGSAGPFPLITYRDVARKAKMIAQVTRTRFMPPWPADPDYRHFQGEKRLSQYEIDLLDKWLNQGRLLGESSLIPPLPHYPDGSQLGEPDLVIEMEKPFAIAGDNLDRFLFMKIPYEIPTDTFIRLIEFVPGNAEVVHHMNGHLISYEYGAKRDVFEGDRYVDREKVPVEIAYPQLGLLNDDKTYPTLTPLVCSYLPGVTPPVYPEDIGGYQMKRKGAMLLNDMHYGPSATDTFDRSRFNVFFAKKPPKRPTMEIQLGTLGISDIVPPLVIPPDTVMTFTTRAVIQHDISLLTLNPHMHLLGKSFLAYAITLEGDTIPLIRIPEWDFRWQFYYTFEKMLKIPRGAVICVEATFDNTSENPYNPFDPPQTVAERDGSMRTTDEMLQFIITYVPYQAGDENISLSGGVLD
ncbi:MAG: cytochrome c [Bacteroidia bacterium]